MPKFYLPALLQPRPVNPASAEVAGGDLRFTDGLQTISGDWALATGVEAATQSVRREAIAAPGSMPRRPQWGAGGVDSVLRGITQQNVGSLLSRQRERLKANPRVASVIDVRVERLANNLGLSVVLEYVPVGTQRPQTTTLGPKR